MQNASNDNSYNEYEGPGGISIFDQSPSALGEPRFAKRDRSLFEHVTGGTPRSPKNSLLQVPPVVKKARGIKIINREVIDLTEDQEQQQDATLGESEHKDDDSSFVETTYTDLYGDNLSDIPGLSSKKIMDKPVRAFVFTDFDTSDLNKSKWEINFRRSAKFGGFTVEFAPSTNKAHLQGVVIYKSTTTINRLRKNFPKARFFFMKGTPKQAWDYCCKTDGERYQHGDLPAGMEEYELLRSHYHFILEILYE